MPSPHGQKRPMESRHDGYDNSRPSPHRPGELGMAQRGQRQSYGHQQYQNMSGSSHQEDRRGGRGGRRPRGGRGGTYQNNAVNPRNNQSRDLGRETLSMTMNPSEAISATRTDEMSSSQTTAALPTSSQQPSTEQPPKPITLQPSNVRQAPEQIREPPPPSHPPPPYLYEILTEQQISSWQESGRNYVITTAGQFLKSEDSTAAAVIFQELLRAGLDARITTIQAGEAIAEILQECSAEDREDLEAEVLDIFSILIDSEIKSDRKLNNPRIRPLLLSTGISPNLMRDMLEDKVLVCMELVRDTFNKMFVRKQTNALYRQSNYNLLREETEGYSKLMTELFTTTNSQPPTSEVVEETFENIEALIGAFDLDAGRVLDVTLDVFANLLVKHYRFFVRLLRQSSWWPTEQRYNGLETVGQEFGSLPLWAEPGYPATRTTDEDVKRLSEIKEVRDRAFWNRAREVGLDAFFELGGRRVVGDPDIDELLNAASLIDDDVRAKETIAWIKNTKTLPPSGNTVAAQLLGFKLRFYASSARDPVDQLPINLIWLAALLIKIGFISLRDLYPHIFPADDAMPAVKEKAMKEREERENAKRPGGGVLNALARAGALVDDTLPTPVSRLRETTANTRASTPARSEAPISQEGSTPAVKPDEESKEQLPEPTDQKIELLKALLCIGAIPEALYILGRFPWLLDGFPDLVEHVHRIIHHSLHKVYQQICPLQHRHGIRQAARPPALDQSGVAKGELRLSDPPAIKTLQWAKIDRKNLEGVDYDFYWHDWTDNVPVCHGVDDVFTLSNTLLNLTGVKIGQDSPLLMIMARIGKHSLTIDPSDGNKTRWIELCKRLLTPSLSLSGCNPGLVNEMYDLLKLFDTPTRYSIYNEWFLGSTSRLLDIESAFSLARAETKDVLKRMSKMNMKPMARALAKAACASPGIVFQVVLNQIESYANLIDVVVECGRYFTYMGYDVLTWTLLLTLGKAGRSRVSQSTGINTSLWLVSLSQFIGKIFKRYTMMNPLPILQYILEQLRQDNFTDLQVLRELCINMAGIAPDTDFTDSQVHAMAGGELLQAQTLKQVHDKRHDNKSSGRRLVKTINDNNLTGSLLVAIAQERQMCIFHSNQNQIKAVAENVDGVGIVLTQFSDLVRHYMPAKDFEQAVPDVVSMIADFGIDPAIAFTIHRKSIAKAMDEYDHEQQLAKKRKSDALNVDEDVEMNGTLEADVGNLETQADSLDQQITGEATDENNLQAPKAESGTKETPSDSSLDQDSVSQDQTAIEVASSTISARHWHPVLETLMEGLKTALPEDFELATSISFFTSFWQLSLNDIMLPTQSYAEEETRQKERLTALASDSSGVRKKDSDKRSINDFLKNMKEEMKTRITKHTQVRTRLEKEKHHWFKGFGGKSMALSYALLQECFLPRAVMSPLDSYFSWRMLNMLHSSGTPGFRTMIFLDVIFRERTLINLMFQCTGREAENLGRFLYEILKELGAWHADKAEYEKRAYGTRRTLPGFVQKMSKEGVVEKLLEYEDFRKLLFKWHSNFSKAARFCIDSAEFMHMKNAIACLKATVRVFPVVNFMSAQICKSLEPYLSKEAETRDDVRVLSNSLYGLLKSKKNLMMPQAFRAGGNDDESLRGIPRPTGAAPKPQIASKADLKDNKTSNATSRDTHLKDVSVNVPESRLKTSNTSNISNNGSSKNPATGPKDVEDGELDDATVLDGNRETKVASKQNATNVSQTLNRPRSESQVEEKRLAEMREKIKASAEAKRLAQASLNNTKPDGINGNATVPTTAQRSIDQSSSRPSTPSANTQTSSSIPPKPVTPGGKSTPISARHALPDRPEIPIIRGRHDTRDAHVASDRMHGRGPPSMESRSPRVQESAQRSGDQGSRLNGTGPQGRPGPTTGRDPSLSNRNDPVSRDMSMPREVRQNLRNPVNGRNIRDQYNVGTPNQSARDGQSSTLNGPVSSTEPSMNPERAAMLSRENEKTEYNGRPSRNVETQGQRPRQDSPTRSDGRGDSERRSRSYPRNEHEIPPNRLGSLDARGNSNRDFNREQGSAGFRNGVNGRDMRLNDMNARPLNSMHPPNVRPNHERTPSNRFQDYPSRSRYQDESYGRLNAEPSDNMDKSSQSPQSSQATQDYNGPPVHPSRRQSITGLANAPPAASTDNRNAMQSNLRPPSQPEVPSAAQDSFVGMHPSRVAAFEREQNAAQPPRPRPIQTAVNDLVQQAQPSLSSPTQQSPTSSIPPSGPRSAHPRGPDSPVAPRNAPAGPAERGRRDNARRFQGLQDALGGNPGMVNGPRNGASQSQFQNPSIPTLSAAGANPNNSGAPNTNAQNQGASIRGLAAAGAANRPQIPPLAQSNQQTDQQDLFAGGRKSTAPQSANPNQGQSYGPQGSSVAVSNAGDDRMRDERDRESGSGRDHNRGDRDRDLPGGRSGRGSYRSSREGSRNRLPETEETRDRERDFGDRRRDTGNQREQPERGRESGRDYGRSIRGGGNPQRDVGRSDMEPIGGRNGREGAKPHRDRDSRGDRDYERWDNGNGRKRPFPDEGGDLISRTDMGRTGGGGRDPGHGGSMKRPRRGQHDNPRE